MNSPYKPAGYTSVSPYFIVEGAQRFIELMQQVFNAKELRRYNLPDGSIMHAELQLEDSVLMLGDASEKYPAVPMVLHVYVPDVEAIFEKAIAAGCKSVQPPKEQEGDPDRRATFMDFGGNMWSIGTQLPG